MFYEIPTGKSVLKVNNKYIRTMRYVKNKVSRVFNDNLDELLFPDAIVK